jgi:hypothetical protein
MQQPGLGVRFLDEVETAWNRLEQNPLLSAVKPMGQGAQKKGIKVGMEFWKFNV